MDEGNGIYNAHSVIPVGGAGAGKKKKKMSPSKKGGDSPNSASNSPMGGISGPPSASPTKTQFNAHINLSPGFRPNVIAGNNPSLSNSAAAGNVGVAFRIRGRPGEEGGGGGGGGGGGAGGGAATLSPQGYRGGGGGGMSGPSTVDGTARGQWIQSEEDEEAKLKKELKAAKARMQKQVQMQEWLEKKEAKALEQFEAEESSRKKFTEDQKERDKQFRKRAKNQKKKLERYYSKLREEMGALDIEGVQEKLAAGGGGDGDMEEDDYGGMDSGLGADSLEGDGFS
jgi:hypothetical protein